MGTCMIYEKARYCADEAMLGNPVFGTMIFGDLSSSICCPTSGLATTTHHAAHNSAWRLPREAWSWWPIIAVTASLPQPGHTAWDSRRATSAKYGITDREACNEKIGTILWNRSWPAATRTLLLVSGWTSTKFWKLRPATDRLAPVDGLVPETPVMHGVRTWDSCSTCVVS